jgi:hypothetical protein
MTLEGGPGWGSPLQVGEILGLQSINTLWNIVKGIN